MGYYMPLVVAVVVSSVALPIVRLLHLTLPLHPTAAAHEAAATALVRFGVLPQTLLCLCSRVRTFAARWVWMLRLLVCPMRQHV